MRYEIELPQIVRRVVTAEDVAMRPCDYCGEWIEDPAEAVWVCWTPADRELRHWDWRTCVLLARAKALIARREARTE